MIDWEKVYMYTIICGLGISVFLLGIGWNHNHDRIDVLSRRIFNLEQRYNATQDKLQEKLLEERR